METSRGLPELGRRLCAPARPCLLLQQGDGPCAIFSGVGFHLPGKSTGVGTDKDTSEPDSPVNVTHGHAHVATPIGRRFRPSIVRCPPFCFTGLGWCLPSWIEVTRSILSGLSSKGILFFKDQGVLQGPRAGNEAWSRVGELLGPRQPQPPSLSVSKAKQLLS